MFKTKGFTLIELLVVIAIIGILSGLIIVSMGSATKSAKDARIKEEMHQLAQQASIYLNTTGYATIYGTAGSGVQGAAGANFSGVGDGLTLYNDIVSAPTGGTSFTLNIAAGVYCMSVALNAGGYYCTDSTGKIVQSSTTNCATGSVTACPN